MIPFPLKQKTGRKLLRISFAPFAAIPLTVGLSLGSTAQTAPRLAAPPAKPNASVTPSSPATHPQAAGEVTDPVARPEAVVTVGQARFTVLTPQLIRMEWAEDGKFEDHASFVFLNRRLSVPQFEKTIGAIG
jgi:hypothetical protein